MLFDEIPKPEPAMRAHTNTVRVEDAFKVGHLACWGVEYVALNVGRDRRYLKEAIAAYGEAEVLVLVTRFFRDKSRRGSYTIADFYAQLPSLRLESQRRNGQPRTAGNVDAAARATGRKP